MAKVTDRKRESTRNRQRAVTSSAQNIGPCPPIKDLSRRRACLDDLQMFGEIYISQPLKKLCGKMHLYGIARLQECIIQGAMFCWSWPRGEGKSTWMRIGAAFAVCNRWRRYPFIVGATGQKATENLEAIKVYLRFLPELAEDFPEICYPFIKLGGQPRRCAGQHSDGVYTSTEWSSNRIILPTMRPPKNWPDDWPLRSDGMVPTAGTVIGSSGLTGEGIRGSVFTNTLGENLRPDLVILDDPQTSESAISISQTAKREDLINGDILGMAGPGESLAVAMPCTVIFPGDLSDKYLNPELYPLWRGHRIGVLNKMPESMDPWEGYLEVYHRCARLEPPNFTEANAYYTANQETIEQGVESTWSERKEPWEVNSIQNAIHMFAKLKMRAFMSEKMNLPLPADLSQLDDLTVDEIKSRVNGLNQGVVPLGSKLVTAFIDVQSRVLFYSVVAWDAAYGGSLIEYGTFPPQSKANFTADEVNPSLRTLWPTRTESDQIYLGVSQLLADLMTRRFTLGDSSGQTLPVGQVLVDCGWRMEPIYRATAGLPNVFASRGAGIGANKAPMGEWDPEPGLMASGWNWRRYREIYAFPDGRRAVEWLLFDPNAWKSSVAMRLRVPIGEPGAITIFGNKASVDAGRHNLLAKHLTSEFRPIIAKEGRRVEEWIIKPGTSGENHWWDCLVGNAVAANVHGMQFAVGDNRPVKVEAVKEKSIEQLYREGISRAPL